MHHKTQHVITLKEVHLWEQILSISWGTINFEFQKFQSIFGTIKKLLFHTNHHSNVQMLYTTHHSQIYFHITVTFQLLARTTIIIGKLILLLL
jgi:hypothetical protein